MSPDGNEGEWYGTIKDGDPYGLGIIAEFAGGPNFATILGGGKAPTGYLPYGFLFTKNTSQKSADLAEVRHKADEDGSIESIYSGYRTTVE